VYWARIVSESAGNDCISFRRPAEVKGRKHPRLALNNSGEMLFCLDGRDGLAARRLFRVADL
jgi:hypothetical protein